MSHACWTSCWWRRHHKRVLSPYCDSPGCDGPRTVVRQPNRRPFGGFWRAALYSERGRYIVSGTGKWPAKGLL